MRIDKSVLDRKDPLAIDSSPILYWDQQGQYTPYSTEEILANRLNSFKGWNCTAGKNSLFIHFEGIVFRGTCMVGGSTGNIYDESFRFPDSDVICPKDFCMCGGDIMAPKFKNKSYASGDYQLKRASTPTQDPVGVTGAEILNFEKSNHSKFLKRVIWSIGKRCNYNCSYCTPEVHNSTEPLKSKDQILKAAEKLVKEFCKGEKTIFYIAGGEPTLYPGLPALVKYLYENGHECNIVSNGSTKPEIYENLIQYSHICLSAHFEFLKEERFLNNIQAMIRVLTKASAKNKAYRHRVDVKLMTKPGEFDQSIALARQIYSIFRYRNHGTIRFNPLWNPENPEILFQYSVEENQQFIHLNEQKSQEKAIKESPLIYFSRALASNDFPTILKEINFYLSIRIKEFIFKSEIFIIHNYQQTTNAIRWTFHSLYTKFIGQSRRIAVNLWNLFYYNHILRKPFYFIRYQYLKRFKNEI